jgi:two-component system NtrC family sensor kinase
MIIGPDYRIQKANLAVAKLAGIPPEKIKDIVGSKCHKILAGRAKPCLGCKLQNTINQESPSQFPLADAFASRVYEVTSQPFNVGEAGPAAVHVYRDRTEAVKMQQKLNQSEKLASIGLLAGGVAHEINNPLGGILIFSQMLLKEMPSNSPHYADVVEIEAAAQRCKSIVESLLDFARAQPDETRIGKVKFQPVDAMDAVASAMRFAKINLKQNQNIRVREKLTGQSAKIMGDKNQLIQVVLNLVQNAIQAMPKGGDLGVSVACDTKHKKLQIDVSDSGKGIPPEILGKIFDPFFTTKQPGEGTGLGLSICYGLVTGMSGQLTVNNKPGKGATFTVTLPIIS